MKAISPAPASGAGVMSTEYVLIGDHEFAIHVPGLPASPAGSHNAPASDAADAPVQAPRRRSEP